MAGQRTIWDYAPVTHGNRPGLEARAAAKAGLASTSWIPSEGARRLRHPDAQAGSRVLAKHAFLPL